MDVTSGVRLSRLPGPFRPCILPAPPTLHSLRPQATTIGGSVPANHAPTAASRYSNTDRPCCVQVAITVQIRSHQRSPLFAPGPLRDQSVDHHEADRLLRQVVRRLHSRRRHEPEITLAMLLEPGRHVATVFRRWHVDRGTTHNSEPGHFQLALELFRREVFAAMDHLEDCRSSSRNCSP